MPFPCEVNTFTEVLLYMPHGRISGNSIKPPRSGGVRMCWWYSRKLLWDHMAYDETGQKRTSPLLDFLKNHQIQAEKIEFTFWLLDALQGTAKLREEKSGLALKEKSFRDIIFNKWKRVIESIQDEQLKFKDKVVASITDADKEEMVRILVDAWSNQKVSVKSTLQRRKVVLNCALLATTIADLPNMVEIFATVNQRSLVANLKQVDSLPNHEDVLSIWTTGRAIIENAMNQALSLRAVPYNPDSPDLTAEALHRLLLENGPLLVGGFFGFQYYTVQPRFIRNLGSRQLYGWSKGERKLPVKPIEEKTTVTIGHTVVIIGICINKDNLDNSHVLYVDPNRLSTSEGSPYTLIMSFRTFKNEALNSVALAAMESRIPLSLLEEDTKKRIKHSRQAQGS